MIKKLAKKIENVRPFIHFWKKRLMIFIAVLGPGVITAVADNDAGGVATYTVAAASYGVASRFLIIFEGFLLGLTQYIGARIAIVTQKGLGDLIRERFGVRLSILIFVLYFITNQGVILQNVTGLKAAYQLFNVPWQIPLILTCIFLIFIVVNFSYARLQKIFLLMVFFYISYVLVAIIAMPNWLHAIRESFIFPTETKLDFNYWFSRIAVLGTTITAWGQFFIHSYIVDKKVSEEHLRYSKWEIIFGTVLTTFLSFMMAIAVSETLFRNHITVTDGYSAALALRPLAGDLTFALFAIGLFGASILGLTIVPLATAYVFSELFGYEGSLDTDFSRGKLFYSFFILQIFIGLIAALYPGTSLFKLTLYVDFLNGAMLPIIFYFLIKFSESRELMGRYAVKGFNSFFLRISALMITLIVILTFVGKILRLY